MVRPARGEGFDARTHRVGRFVMVGLQTPQRRRSGMASDIRGYAESQSGDCVSLWWAPLDISDSVQRGFCGCLSSQERRRADRIRHPVARGRFVAARRWLRYLLASQLDCEPEDVPMVTGDQGKPSIAGSDLAFSASRTAGVALYATSRRMEVGVDVEAIRATIDVDGMAARFLSPTEQRALASLSPARRLTAFFECWTRKEAHVKGIGTGLGCALRDMDVSCGGRQPATLSGWSVHQVDLAPGLAAAVAGASLEDWVPQMPRPMWGARLDHSYRPAPGYSDLAALAISVR